MLNNKISDYKTINTAIAIFGAFSALVLALAPATVATIFKISYQVQSTGSWLRKSYSHNVYLNFSSSFMVKIY